jgi:hypothetical protein
VDPTIQPIIIRTIDQPTQELGIGATITQALGISGMLLLGSLIFGLLLGALFIWYRKRQVAGRAAGEAGDQIRLHLDAGTRTNVA